MGQNGKKRPVPLELIVSKFVTRQMNAVAVSRYILHHVISVLNVKMGFSLLKTFTVYCVICQINEIDSFLNHDLRKSYIYLSNKTSNSNQTLNEIAIYFNQSISNISKFWQNTGFW